MLYIDLTALPVSPALPQQPRTYWAHALYLTLGDCLLSLLALYGGALEGEVEPRHVSSASASESPQEEEARFGVQSVRIYIEAYRRM